MSALGGPSPESLGSQRTLPTWRDECSLRTFVARVAHNREVDHVDGQKRQDLKAVLGVQNDR